MLRLRAGMGRNVTLWFKAGLRDAEPRLAKDIEHGRTPPPRPSLPPIPLPARVAGMERLITLSRLLRERNEIDKGLAALIGRPPTVGALGEYVAAAIFDIQLESSAVSRGIDGRFGSGPLAGRTVDIKC